MALPQFNCSLCDTMHYELDTISEEGEFPSLRRLEDLRAMRRQCIETHRWPGCENNPEFTQNGMFSRPPTDHCH
jgi:hypothetical protein